MADDERTDATGEDIRLPLESGQAAEEGSGELRLDRRVPTEQAPGGRAVPGRHQVRDLPAVARSEHQEGRMEPVPDAGRLCGEVLPSLQQQARLARAVGQPMGGRSGSRAVTRAMARASPGSLLPGRCLRWRSARLRCGGISRTRRPASWADRASRAPNDDEPSTPMVASGATDAARAISA